MPLEPAALETPLSVNGHATKPGIPRRVPLRDFFRLPDKSGFKISPDGNFISYFSPYERRKNIFVEPRHPGHAADESRPDAVRITSETSRDIGGYWWKGNNRIIYTRDFGGDENYHLFAADRDGSNPKDLTPFENVQVQLIDDLEDVAEDVLIAMNKRKPEIFDVYCLNIVTGEMRMVAENPGNITNWFTDHDGKIRVASVTDGVNTTLLYRETEADEWRSVITTSFKEAAQPLFFTFDNKYLYCSSNLDRDKAAIVKFDIANGKEMEVIFQHPDVDVENLSYSRKRKVLTAISFTTWKHQRLFLDAEVERIFTRLLAKLPNYEVSINSVTREEDVFIIRTYSDRSLGAFYLYDTITDELTKLADISPWLREEDLATMKPISYASRDGLTIHGYLTLPKGREPKNLPVIVNPHGGPWVRDTWGYNPEVQLFANRGYAVIQVNYRGSTGYGRAFWESSFKQWGRKMQDDLTDAVQWMIKQGIADPNRVAIYGGSYGGYAALAGVTFTPDVYKCAIDYVGVSNLLTFLGTIPPYWKPYLEMMYEMVGNPTTEKELLMAASPVFHCDKIKVPMLVIQGAKDPRVNINESEQIVEALKRHDIDVTYIVKENEGHGFANEENRFDAYEAMEAFLERHL
jgi:dipeptidyl aminopeptidase/acylaminoacyl peptidase